MSQGDVIFDNPRCEPGTAGRIAERGYYCGAEALITNDAIDDRVVILLITGCDMERVPSSKPECHTPDFDGSMICFTHLHIAAGTCRLQFKRVLFDDVSRATGNSRSSQHSETVMQDTKKDLNVILEEVLENVSVLQIKVGALETIVLKDKKTHAEYTRLVNEQADVLTRERQNKPSTRTAKKTPRA